MGTSALCVNDPPMSTVRSSTLVQSKHPWPDCGSSGYSCRSSDSAASHDDSIRWLVQNLAQSACCDVINRRSLLVPSPPLALRQVSDPSCRVGSDGCSSAASAHVHTPSSRSTRMCPVVRSPSSFEPYSRSSIKLLRLSPLRPVTNSCRTVLRDCHSAPNSPSTVGSPSLSSPPLTHDHYDVFLGGSCNPTTWRRELAIPQLEQLKLTYYNPQMASWHPDLIAVEEAAKQSSHVLFFVIDSQTRAVASTVEAAYLAAAGRLLLLIVSKLASPHVLHGDLLSRSEYEELTLTRDCLVSLVKSCHLPTFNSVPAALDCIQQILHDAKHRSTRVAHTHTHPVDTSSPSNDTHTGCPRVAASLSKPTSTTATPTTTLASAWSSTSAGGAAFNNKQQQKQQGDMLCASVTSKLARILARTADHVIPGLGTRRPAKKASHPATATTRDKLTRQSSACGADPPVVAEGVCESDFRSSTRATQPPLTVLTLPAAAVSAGSNRCDVCLVADSSMTCWMLETAGVQLRERDLSVRLVQVDNLESLNSCERQLVPAQQLQLLAAHTGCLVFVVNAEAACSRLLALAAHSVGASVRCAALQHAGRCRMALCVESIPSPCGQPTQSLSEAAVKDYNRGRSYLVDVARRGQLSVVNTRDLLVATVVSLMSQR